MTGFFVLTSTRSGSTWFLTLLNEQAGLRAHGEIFLWREVRPEFAWVAKGDPERFYTRRHALGSWRPRQLARYLDEVEQSLAGASAGGFKLIVSHLRKVPELAALLLWRRYRMILLIRDNVFESTVSEMIALATNAPHGRAPAEAPDAVTLDAREVVRRIRSRRRGIRAMHLAQRLWPWGSVVVQYEDLARDQTAALAPVLRLLGCPQPPRHVTSSLTRRITRPYSVLIRNYPEVAAALGEAGLQDYLPDPEPLA